MFVVCIAFVLERVGALFFFFNDTATTEIYTLSLHDALPIWGWEGEAKAVFLFLKLYGIQKCSICILYFFKE